MASRMGSEFDMSAAAKTGKRFAFGAFLLFLTIFVGCATTRRVDAGHVGVKVKMMGGNRGVQDEPLLTGWHFFNPVTEQIILFPTNVQSVVWSSSPHEGKAHDESINFSSMEGANISADIGLAFHVDAGLAPQLYNRFRQNDMLSLAHSFLRNTVREAFSEISSKLRVDEIYGVGKNQMVAQVTELVRERLGKYGIIIDQLTINGALRLPALVADAINRALEASQNAAQSRNRVAQFEAEARQAITQAHGQAEAARQKAQGEADSVLIRAKAEAQANEIIRLSISPIVLQYRQLEKWDGKLPTYQMGDKSPMMVVDVGKLGDTMDDATRHKRLRELIDAIRPAGPLNPAASIPVPLPPPVVAPIPSAAPVPSAPKPR